jgi:hypothetical protein
MTAGYVDLETGNSAMKWKEEERHLCIALRVLWTAACEMSNGIHLQNIAKYSALICADLENLIHNRTGFSPSGSVLPAAEAGH